MKLDSGTNGVPGDSQEDRSPADIPAGFQERASELLASPVLSQFPGVLAHLDGGRRREDRLRSWQIEHLGRDAWGIGQQHCPLNDVGELPYVARPTICKQRSAPISGQVPLGDVVLAADALEDVFSEKDDIIRPLSDRESVPRELRSKGSRSSPR
jgi:hypothetical protein